MGSDWVQEIITLTKEFPNVYTDLSCFDLEERSVRCNVMELFLQMKNDPDHKHLQDKVIFGVDWYLSLITKAPNYEEYVESFFDMMDEYDEWQWYRSAIVNPATFYGLDDKTVINNMQLSLTEFLKKENGLSKQKLKDNYSRILALSKQVETIRNELSQLILKK